MVSEAKLIKVGIKYSDQFFEQLKKIYGDAFSHCDSLEEFLNETKDYSISNPLETSGYKDQMVNLIVSSTNNIKYNRPAQKALMQTIIRNTTGELIVDVGDDIKSGVRDIVNRGYREGKLNHVRVADEISSTLDGINHKRARTIARTEIKRAQTTSNYVIAKERGANAYKYKCGAKPCDICKGDCRKTFPIDDLEHLPPRHPNCMCGVTFFVDPNLPKPEREPETVEPTKTTKPTGETQTKSETQSTEKSSNGLFSNQPKIYEEKHEHFNAKYAKSVHDVITYDYGNIKLSIEKGAMLTHDEVISHINSLPKKFQDTKAKRIVIYAYQDKSAGGLYNPLFNEVSVYKSKSKATHLDVLNHELSHSIDIDKQTKKYSDPKIYEKIFKADNELYKYKHERTGRWRTPKKFPTEYAGKSYLKSKRKKRLDDLYVEDFADSSKLYLNPKTHKQFVKDFPNRAKYLESIYGKPVFDKNSVLSRELANEKKISNERQKAQNLKELKNKKFESLTSKELDVELEKVLGSKERVKAYHNMEAELNKLESVQNAVMSGDIRLLTEAGWSQSMAERIMANPNDFLPKVREKKNKIKSVVNQVSELIKENLDLTKPSTVKTKSETKPKETSKSKPTEEKAKPKQESKPESKQEPKADPVERGKNISKTTTETYEGGLYKGLKSVEYSDGTKITFKKASNSAEYPFQTLESVTINGKTYTYKEKDVYDHFKYQDAQLTKEELKFADDFIQMYGTYAGKAFNSARRGKLSKEDLAMVKDDEAYKWLNKNYKRYNEILEKSVIEEDIVTMRVQAKNYVPKGAKTIQDPAYTSSSAGVSRGELIDCFGNGRDIDSNWTYFTITPAGTKGVRFQGNSVVRKYGSLDDDFEREVTYKPNMKFDILLIDEKNKIMILQPRR